MASLIMTAPARSCAAIFLARAALAVQTLAARATRGSLARAGEGFVGSGDALNREDGAEGFFLEEARCGVDVDDDGWLEEICAEVGTRLAAVENSGATGDGVFDQRSHSLDVLRADERADVG